ncbi:effector-associated domain EAD1-containing protein [Phytohabitans sp. LJ34]|uniref:effector-associated domain EAD1-containing protein n=1 Tax=Phytohabitans sp. LJ34 TaxID=3452217 RepID=UPI003F890DB8
MDPEQALSFVDAAEAEERLAADPAVERLAVLGTFDPGALRATSEGASLEHLLCRPLPARGGRPEVVLFERRRIDALAAMLRRGGQAELARIRREVRPEHDTPLQRVLDDFVLATGRPVTALSEDELVVALDVWRWATEAVARAGLAGTVKVTPSRAEIEGRLALLEVVRSVRKLADAGCLGREHEVARLHAYRTAAPVPGGLAADPAMVVYGVGGVGKSTLVARFVMDMYESCGPADRWAWAYLDFDRPTLSACEPTAVLNDVIRQVGAQFPEYRRELEHDEDVAHRRGKGAGLEAADTATSYRERAAGFARGKSMVDTALVVVLDTFEEVERTRPDRAADLFDLFATLAGELRSFRLVVSGRGPASVFLAPGRHDRQLHVLPLGEEAAADLLRYIVRQEAGAAAPPIDDALAREIIGLVGGIPLTVRLAAQVLVREGSAAVEDAAARARALDRVRVEFVRGFLYQRILNHVSVPDERTTDELRRVAQASLVLRRISVDLVERVLVPALWPPPTLPPAELFGGLASQLTMAERDGDVLRLREELRGPALAALKLHDPKLVSRVGDLAVGFYEGEPRSDDTDLELTYHRLAQGDLTAPVDADTIRRLGLSVADFPPSSARLIHAPHALAVSDDLANWERRTAPAVDVALRKGDLSEARRLLTGRPERMPGTELHRLESRVAEAGGDLRLAAEASRKDVRAAQEAGDATRTAAAVVRLARLEERLGESEAAQGELQKGADLPLLAGHPELRLELLLNRMNMLERGRLGDGDLRWSLGLGVRGLIQRYGPRNVTHSTALVRLLAAALGQEEPDRLKEAVRLVGLGHEEDLRRVRAIVSAIADWDLAREDPGRLARQLGLRPLTSDREGLEAAWRTLTGLGTDAGLLLDRLWRLEFPPEPVREAIRALYLWWAVDSGTEQRPASATHFLAETPLDWSRQETRELEDILLTVYSTSTDSRMLASAAGLDMTLISWSGSARRVTRELIGTASRGGRLDALVRAVLADPASGAVRDRLRSLVGDAWLSEHGRP